MNPRLQVQAGHFTNITTDLAEIFMNILVTHKILFYSAKERREMREKNQFDISKTIAHSVCLFANSFHCPNVMNSKVVILHARDSTIHFNPD